MTVKERPEQNESINHQASVEDIRKEWSAGLVGRRPGGWSSLCKEEAMSNQVSCSKIDLGQGFS